MRITNPKGMTEFTATISGSPVTLYGIPVSSGGNVTIGSQQYIADTMDSKGVVTRRVGVISSYAGETVATSYMSTTGGLDTGATVYYVLTTPTTEQATLSPEALTAVVPTTTWLSESYTSMTYNQDVIMVIASLKAAIISLGGNIQ